MATTFIGPQFRPNLYTDTTRKPTSVGTDAVRGESVRTPGPPPMKSRMKEIDEKNTEKCFCEGQTATGTVRGTPPVINKFIKDKDSSEKSAESTGSVSSNSPDNARSLGRFLHSQG